MRVLGGNKGLIEGGNTNKEHSECSGGTHRNRGPIENKLRTLDLGRERLQCSQDGKEPLSLLPVFP